MKIIFLDIDGVFVTHKSIDRFHNGKQFGPENVKEFNRIIRRTGAKIVVSSVWRLYNSFEGLVAELRSNGLEGTFIGTTPRIPAASAVRGLEIQAWMDRWKRIWRAKKDTIESFVILDDDSDMHHLMPRLVKTTFAEGLTQKEGDRVFQMLGVRRPSTTRPSRTSSRSRRA